MSVEYAVFRKEHLPGSRFMVVIQAFLRNACFV